jgi:hypothetical protein
MAEFKPSSAKYSLRTLLVVVAMACFAIGSYVIGTRLSEAERELRTLRNETGNLTVDDRSKVHVIALDSDEQNSWRWRMFVPKGRKYSLNISAESIPKDDVPPQAQMAGYSNEPYWERENEVLVTAKLRQLDDGNWRLSVSPRIGDSKNQMAGAALQIPKEKLQWMTEVSATDGRVAGSNGVKIFKASEPIILLQRRPCERQPDGSYQPSPNPMPGFMIWLKEE